MIVREVSRGAHGGRLILPQGYGRVGRRYLHSTETRGRAKGPSGCAEKGKKALSSSVHALPALFGNAVLVSFSPSKNFCVVLCPRESINRLGVALLRGLRCASFERWTSGARATRMCRNHFTPYIYPPRNGRKLYRPRIGRLMGQREEMVENVECTITHLYSFGAIFAVG